MGLNGALVVQDNFGDDLSLAANGHFVFATPIAAGGTYSITVRTQPSAPPQSCGILNGAGTVNADVNDVLIVCENLFAPPLDADPGVHSVSLNWSEAGLAAVNI